MDTVAGVLRKLNAAGYVSIGTYGCGTKMAERLEAAGLADYHSFVDIRGKRRLVLIPPGSNLEDCPFWQEWTAASEENAS